MSKPSKKVWDVTVVCMREEFWFEGIKADTEGEAKDIAEKKLERKRVTPRADYMKATWMSGGDDDAS